LKEGFESLNSWRLGTAGFGMHSRMALHHHHHQQQSIRSTSDDGDSGSEDEEPTPLHRMAMYPVPHSHWFPRSLSFKPWNRVRAVKQQQQPSGGVLPRHLRIQVSRPVRFFLLLHLEQTRSSRILSLSIHPRCTLYSDAFIYVRERETYRKKDRLWKP
jgi:hypothetical protein